MTNPLKGEVEVAVEPIEGEAPRSLTLVYDFEALVALEDVLDKSIIEVLALVNKGLRLGTLRAFFWAGLRAHHPEISFEDAGPLIQRCGGMILLSDKVFEAVGKAFPAPAKEAALAPGPRKPAARKPPAAAGTPSAASDSGSSTT